MANEKEKNIAFNGRLITQYHPTLLSDGDFSSLTNFCYTPVSIKAIQGMSSYKTISSSDQYTVVSSSFTTTKHNNLVGYQIYPTTTPSSDIISAIYVNNEFPSDSTTIAHNISGQTRILALKYSSSTAYISGQIAVVSSTVYSPTTFYLECITTGTTGSSPPDFASYSYNDVITDGTVQWIKRKGNLIGEFTQSPDDTLVFCNGQHNLIYGGNAHRLGAIINTDTISGLSDELITNGDFATSASWSWGSGWSWDATHYEADHTPESTDVLSQTVSIIAGATYQIVYTVKNTTAGSVTFYVGSKAGTARNADGTYTEILVASTSSNPIFVPTSDFNGSIDDVSLKRVYYPNDIDITDRLTNEQTDTQHIAVMTIATDGNLYLDIGSPLMLRGLNISILSPNDNNNTTLRIYRNTSSGWQLGTITTDNTNKLQNIGTYSVIFSFTGDDTTNTLDHADVVTYLHSKFLYWYSLRLVPSSGVLPASITLSYMTGRTVIQTIPNIWDGALSIPSSFFVETGTDTYVDNTIEVSRRENEFQYTSYWEPSIGTTSRIYNYTTYYIGSVLPLTGYRIYFPTSGQEISPRSWVNTDAATITVYYWDGNSWQAVPGLTDDTMDSSLTITHNRNGTVRWLPITNERQRTIYHDITLYYYKVVSTAKYSSYTYIDYIELIPYRRPIEHYNTCTIWNNRLVLAGSNSSNAHNQIICSAPDSPYIWEGEQPIVMYAGDNTPITGLATLYTRYGTDIAETLLIFKANELFMVTGYDQETVKVFPISHSIGTPYPQTIQVCDFGLRITEGVNRGIVIFANDNGVYFYDNAAFISISDDINPSVAVGPFNYASSYYDPAKSWYHFFFYNSTVGWNEYVFDLINKKWFKIDRGDAKIFSGLFYSSSSYGFASTTMATLNSGYTMLGSSYTASFTTALKPLESSLVLEYIIRRAKLFASSSTSTCALTITTDTSTYSPSSLSLDTTAPVYISSPIPLNLNGSVLKISGTVNVSANTELINLSLLYSPVRLTW